MGSVRHHVRTGLWLLLGLVALVATGCSLPSSPSMRLVPPEWRHRHPFGLAANTARARGELRSDNPDPRVFAWNAFAHQWIHDGDILFRRGRSYTLAGRITSRSLAAACGGKYSHDGLAHWEGNRLWIYDVESEGVRKVPFDIWMLDVADDTFAIRRVKPEHRDRIPYALVFCEEAYRRDVPFDFALDPSDDRFYCSEMVEKAYRSAGLALSEPVPICALPGYKYFRLVAWVAHVCYGVQVESPVFSLGNESYGTFGSPQLETVFVGDINGGGH